MKNDFAHIFSSSSSPSSKMLTQTFFLALATCLSIQAASIDLLQIIPNAVDWDPSQTPFPSASRGNISFAYKSATKGEVNVPDPYHWFEDTNSSANEIKLFRESQVAFTNAYLNKAKSTKDSFENSLDNSMTFPFISVPKAYGPKDNLLYLYQVIVSNRTDDLGVWYLTNQTELDKAVSANFTTLPGIPFLDTNLVGVNRTVYDFQISPDGKSLAYVVIENTNYELFWTYFRKISDPLTNETTKKNEEGGTGHFPNDVIEQAFSSQWLPDSSAILYVKDEKIKNESSSNRDSLRFHTLGTNVKDDPIIVPPPENLADSYNLFIADDKQYMVFYHTQTVNYTDTAKVYVASLHQNFSASSIKWLPITVDNSNNYAYLTNVGEHFYFKAFQSDTNATFVRFALDFTQAKQVNSLSDFKVNLFHPEVLIPIDPDAVLQCVTTFDTNKLIVSHLRNDHSEIFIHNLETNKRLQNFTLPNFSMVDETEATPFGNRIFISASSMNSPAQRYHIDFDRNTNQTTYGLYYAPKSEYVDPNEFVVEQKWVSSTGGVKVPVFLMYRKGIQLDGSNPSIIDVYGGYGIGQSTWYNHYYFAFAHDYNGIIVLAGVRGGNDVGGEVWHDAGKLGNKQHTFDDVLAVANYLVDQKYTSAGKLILSAEASGAMSSAAVVNQAPEGLFGALIAKRGIYDMLRLDISVEASFRIREYGNPQDPKAFDWIYAYTPLDNIDKNKTYPIILINPGDDQDNTEPWHCYKFLAELQFLLPTNPFPFFLGDAKANPEDVKANSYAIAIHALGLKSVS